uniref:Arogenate dehydrogenase alpha n=1 Tax=Simmondsia chinensis TaxID=3999 RepID=A0A386QX81_SIMCH|nr:arogenate dehydrogenase alpha [Simmondsia chinensis]
MLSLHHAKSPLYSPPLPLPSFRHPHLHCRLHLRATLNGALHLLPTATSESTHPTKLKIAIIGFGNFGQFLAKTLVQQGHSVLAHSRTDHSAAAASMGATFYTDPHDLCESHPDVILLCTSILSTERVLRTLPLHRLRRSTLFVDVLSVKEFPRSLFLHLLPPDFDILCTHPMFGPDSARHGWAGLPLVFDRVRVGSNQDRAARVESFLDIFRREGCRMVEMSCAEHDRYAAGSQFITHMMGRVLEKLELEDTPINTKGYESLLKLVDNTAKDSFELFYGLFLYNKNAMKQLERMDVAFETIKKQLAGHLHGMVTKQLILETHNSNSNSNSNSNTNANEKKERKLLPVPVPVPVPVAGAKLSTSTSKNFDLVVAKR